MTEHNPVTGSTGQVGSYEPQWSTWTRQLAIVVLLIAAVYGLTLLLPILQLLTTAFLIALVLFAPSRMMSRRTPIPYSISVIVVYVLLLIVFVLVMAIIVPAVISGISDLRQNAEQAASDLQVMLKNYKPEQGVITLLNAKVDLNVFVTPVREFVLGSSTTTLEGINTTGLGQIISTLTGSLSSIISSVTGFVTTNVMALFLSFLILLELPKEEHAVFRAIPPVYHRELALLIRKISHVWNGFFRGQALIGAIIGIVTYIQLKLMGIPDAGVLAILTGVVSLIPTIGGFMALVPLGLVPLLQGSTVIVGLSNGAVALLVVGVNLIVSQIIWNVVAPTILGDVLDLPLPVIILGVFVGATLGGALGAFLIAPFISTIRVLVLYMLKKIGKQDPFPGELAPANIGTELFAQLTQEMPEVNVESAKAAQ